MTNIESNIRKDIVIWPSPTLPYSVVFSASAGKALYLDNGVVELLRENNLSDFTPETLGLLKTYGIVGVDKEMTPDISELKESIAEHKSIAMLDLIISEGCNFACPHCIHSNNVEDIGTRRLNTYMDLDTAKAAIDQFIRLQKSNGATEFDVNFSAAEPLMNWKAVSGAIEYLDTHRNDFEIRFHMTTNLSLLDHEKALFLARHNVRVSSSLDGNKAANDKIRIDRKGAGTYDKIIEKIALLKEAGNPLDSITLTLTDGNIDLLNAEEYLDVLQNMGMNGLGLDFDVITSCYMSGKEVADKLFEIYEAAMKRGMYCVGTWDHPMTNLLRGVHEAPSLFCKGLSGGNISVSPQRDLYLCGYTSTKLGSLDQIETGFGENLNKLLDIREKFVESHCSKCSLRSVCRGQCHTTLEAAQASNNMSKIDLMCDMYRSITKKVTIFRMEAEVRASQT